MKIRHIIVATLAALFLLTVGSLTTFFLLTAGSNNRANDAADRAQADVNRGSDAADRAKADAIRARKAASQATLASLQARMAFDLAYNARSATLSSMMWEVSTADDFTEARKKHAGFVDVVENGETAVNAARRLSSHATTARDKAEKSARKAAHAAANGLTDRAIEAAFDAAEFATEAAKARDRAIDMCNTTSGIIRKIGGDPITCQ